MERGQRDKDKRLLKACEEGDAEEVKRAIEEGADVEAKNWQVSACWCRCWCVVCGTGWADCARCMCVGVIVTLQGWTPSLQNHNHAHRQRAQSVTLSHTHRQART